MTGDFARAVLLARLASARLGERRFEDVVAIVEELRASGHSTPALDYNLAYAYAHLGRHAEAEPLLRGLPERGPGATVLFVRVLHHLGKLEEGIAVGEEHMKANPADPVMAALLSALRQDAQR